MYRCWVKKKKNIYYSANWRDAIKTSSRLWYNIHTGSLSVLLTVLRENSDVRQHTALTVCVCVCAKYDKQENIQVSQVHFTCENRDFTCAVNIFLNVALLKYIHWEPNMKF